MKSDDIIIFHQISSFLFMDDFLEIVGAVPEFFSNSPPHMFEIYIYILSFLAPDS